MDTTSITVTACFKVKEVNGKPIYSIGLSDGRGGESFNQEIPIGTPAGDLEITQTQYGLRIKKKGQASGPGGSRGNFQRVSEYEKFPGFAMAWSKDLAVAGKISIDDMGKMADRFLGYLDAKHSKRSGAAAPAAAALQPAQQQAQQQQRQPDNGTWQGQQQGPQGPADQSTDDLPF